MKKSVALARYKPEARMIWLSSEVAAGGVAADGWPSLGFIPAPTGAITNPGQKRRLVQLFRQDGNNNTGDWYHPIWDDDVNYDVFIGVWNESYQGAMEAYDAELAEFYNKYALLVDFTS